MSDFKNRLEELFNDCVKLPHDEQIVYLESSCGDDVELKNKVLSLLEYHTESDSNPSEVHEQDPLIGTTIDRYVIRKILGEGGFGVVYLAEQTGELKRKVAIKVIKLGMDTKAVLSRFESERQTLSMMNHPDIVQIYDAGITKEGRPYFAMEFVEGIPITKFCDKHRLSLKERIQMFMEVCEATQHAHTKGVIHRDLKPSNILVGYDGEKTTIEIIDFGVSKVLEHGIGNNSLFTEHGQIIGTPDYMSPEQAEMTALNVDTRSDIYSLGVILYELLSGQLPFDPKELREGGLSQIQRVIREKQPPRPSTRCNSIITSCFEEASEIAEARKVDPAHLASSLKKDLDWVIMMCLEKDRARRYQTCLDLSSDLTRYLTDNPINARPQSTIYKLKKLIVRRKKTVIVSSITAILLSVLISVTGFLYLRAIALDKLATVMDEFMSRIASSLVEESYESGDSSKLRTVLGLAEEVCADYIEDEQIPYSKFIIGFWYSRAGLYEDAYRLQSVAVEQIFPEGLKLPLTSKLAATHFGYLHLTQLGLHGVNDETMKTIEEAINTFSIIKHSDIQWLGHGLRGDGKVLSVDYGKMLLKLDLPEKAEHYLRMANDWPKEYTQHVTDDVAINNKIVIDDCIGRSLYSQGRYDEAKICFLDALLLNKSNKGHPVRWETTLLEWLGRCCIMQGDFSTAETHFRKTLLLKRDRLGNENLQTLYSMQYLAQTLLEQNKYHDAGKHHRELLGSYRKVLGDKNPKTLKAMSGLAFCLYREGEYSEAASYFDEALASMSDELGPKHVDTVDTLGKMADLYSDWGKPEEAKKYRDLIPVQLKNIDTDNN